MSGQTGEHNIVCPFISAMSQTISASAVALAVAQETVNIADIDQHFEYVFPTEAAAIAFLNAFTVSGAKDGGIPSERTDADPSGNNLTVILSGADAFKSALLAAINGAQNATPEGINAWLNKQLTQALSANILTTLGVNVYVTSSVAVNAEGARDSAHGGLTDATLGAPRCETMYLQISKDGLYLYQNASTKAPTTAALPLQKGDKLVFVFDVPAPSTVTVNNAGGNLTNITRQSPGSSTSADASTESVIAGAAPVVSTSASVFAWDSVSVAYNGQIQRVAVSLKMPGASGAFPVGGGAGRLKAWA